MSCDGHGEKKPFFVAVDEENARLAAWLLNFRATQFNQSGKTVKYAGSGPNPNATKPADRLKKMLDVAEWLAKNREDLKNMLAAMRKVSAPKTPAKTDTSGPERAAAKERLGRSRGQRLVIIAASETRDKNCH